MGGPKRGPEGQCRANCRYRAERRNPWSCDYASITGKTRLGACRRRGAGTDVGECPLYAPREKSKKAINAAVLFVVMVVAVCVTTIRCGEAEAERFADAGKMMSETGETDSTPRVLASADRITDPGGDWRRVALLLGMTAPAVVKYDSADEGGKEEIFHSCEGLEMTEIVVYRTDIPLDAREQDALIEACREFDVPYELALAVIWQETDYQNIVGDNGNSMGYMQLQPLWVWPEMEELGVTDLMGPADNFRVGCCLLGRYIETHGIEGGLTRYNTGSPGWSAYAEEVLEKWEVLKG